MAKFNGKIGYATGSTIVDGVAVNTIAEREYSGDVIRDSKSWQQTQNLNNDLTVGHRISIVADSFAFDNIMTMRYVIWAGVPWKIVNVEHQRPRLILSLGGMYNGPIPS